MSLSPPRILYGVHSISPYRPESGEPYGMARVIGQFSTNFSGELQELRGGSAKFPWAVEESSVAGELSISFKEYASWMFTLFLGATPVETGAAGGSVSGFENAKGSSVKASATGIAAVSVIPSTGAANLKFTRYVIKVASSTTVDIYALSDVDFSRGTGVEHIDDSLKVAAAQTVASETDTDIASLGIRLEGGDGSIGMTIGDTAVFEVLPPSLKSMEAVIGARGQTFPEFGCLAVGQKRGSGEMVEIDIYRCKGAGLPLSFQENSWSEAETAATALYDSARNGVYKIRHVTPA